MAQCTVRTATVARRRGRPRRRRGRRGGGAAHLRDRGASGPRGPRGARARALGGPGGRFRPAQRAHRGQPGARPAAQARHRLRPGARGRAADGDQAAAAHASRETARSSGSSRWTGRFGRSTACSHTRWRRGRRADRCWVRRRRRRRSQLHDLDYRPVAHLAQLRRACPRRRRREPAPHIARATARTSPTSPGTSWPSARCSSPRRAGTTSS